MPDWVQQEKREFEEVFDKNRDGKYVFRNRVNVNALACRQL